MVQCLFMLRTQSTFALHLLATYYFLVVFIIIIIIIIIIVIIIRKYTWRISTSSNLITSLKSLLWNIAFLGYRGIKLRIKLHRKTLMIPWENIGDFYILRVQWWMGLEWVLRDYWMSWLLFLYDETTRTSFFFVIWSSWGSFKAVSKVVWFCLFKRTCVFLLFC